MTSVPEVFLAREAQMAYSTVGGWSESDWLQLPRALGAALAGVLGCGADDLLVADSTSVNHHKLLQLALAAARYGAWWCSWTRSSPSTS